MNDTNTKFNRNVFDVVIPEYRVVKESVNNLINHFENEKKEHENIIYK